MYRRSRFLVGLAAAAITFGSLWFSMGPEHFNRGHRLCERPDHCYMQETNRRHCFQKYDEQHADSVIIVKKIIIHETVKK